MPLTEHTVRSWTVESSPTSEGLMTWHDHAWIDSALADLPDLVRDRLVRLVEDQFDEGVCEANECCAMLGGARPDPRPVGYTLAGDADQYMNWHWACIVIVPAAPATPHTPAQPEQAIVVCEECDPSSIYQHVAVSA